MVSDVSAPGIVAEPSGRLGETSHWTATFHVKQSGNANAEWRTLNFEVSRD
jgi:hypothetical protein